MSEVGADEHHEARNVIKNTWIKRATWVIFLCINHIFFTMKVKRSGFEPVSMGTSEYQTNVLTSRPLQLAWL